jgi:hypothetical protein
MLNHYNNLNAQQKKKYPTFQSYLNEIQKRESGRLKSNAIGADANRKGSEIAKRNNALYDAYIAEYPEEEVRRIKGKQYTRDDYLQKKKEANAEQFAREHPTRDAWNKKFFVPAVQGLTDVADDLIHVAPKSVQALYKNFAPPTSKFYKDNLLKAVGGGLSEDIATPLTGTDVQSMMNGSKMYTFKELRNINTAKELLGKDKCAIVLYELQPSNGHWTMVFERPNGDIECFDSLGFAPDSEIGFIPKSFAKESKQDHTHLLQLLANVPNSIEYNEKPLQENASGINTCGKWCIFRYAYKDLSIKQFQAMCKKNKIDDAFVTKVISKDKLL